MTDGRNPESTAPWSRDDLAESGMPMVSQISQQLRDVDALSRAFERRLGSVLTVNQTDLTAMEHLIQEGPLTPSELATRLKVTTAASTLVVDRLVALGHAERHPHEHDRRKIVVVPARSSVDRTVQELLPIIHGIAGIVDDLSEAERTVVSDFLARVADVYRAAVTAP
ncbi:MarR family winged helix-turn-helix transcriptional regulator [Herbiconiux liangxiaofengii]|uniref:MarR family winged helix-turn-helix transcriptional regulator n=1 Tax=Herbiconiux liangxiaofengii TaxID=3342795 RepID=UPI0035B70024